MSQCWCQRALCEHAYVAMTSCLITCSADVVAATVHSTNHVAAAGRDRWVTSPSMRHCCQTATGHTDDTATMNRLAGLSYRLDIIKPWTKRSKHSVRSAFQVKNFNKRCWFSIAPVHFMGTSADSGYSNPLTANAQIGWFTSSRKWLSGSKSWRFMCWEYWRGNQ